MAGLIFKRDKGSGVYWAYGETLGYSIVREGDQWMIDVREVKITAGVKHTLGQPILYFMRTRASSLALARDIVRRVEADPKHDIHAACMAAYDAEHQARVAEFKSAGLWS